MGFTARIIFTGICGIVPKAEDAADPKAICAVLPNAWNEYPNWIGESSVDGYPLRRHTAFVQFATRLPQGFRQDLEGLWFLRNHILLVKPTFESGNSPTRWGDIDGLASYEDIIARADSKLLNVERAVRSPDPQKIIGQVFVENGEISSPEGNPLWVFDNYLRPREDFVVKRVNHRLTVTIERLSRLEIIQRDFAGNPVNTFAFTAGDASVVVANLCDYNPLQWGRASAPHDDEDFRWYYEIVDYPADLKAKLGQFRCPVPRLTTGMGGGNGLNCVDFKFPAVDFSVPSA